MTFSKHIAGVLPHQGKFSSRFGTPVSRLIVHHWAGITGGDGRLTSTALDTPSANYIIYSDGRIIGQVPEEYRAWTSGSHLFDAPSITVEVQNSATGGVWPVSPQAFNALTILLADLATRYSFNLDSPASCIGHRDVYATACPGDYLYSRLGELRAKAKARNSTVRAKTSAAISKAKAKIVKPSKTVSQLADEVLAGKHGNGEQRKKSLGSMYQKVQAEVNRRLKIKKPVVKPAVKPAVKTDAQLADDVIAGKYGNGSERVRRLGSRYKTVQALVEKKLAAKNAPKQKSIKQLADEVLAGKHGNGEARRKSLGGLYQAVQAEINRRLYGK